MKIVIYRPTAGATAGGAGRVGALVDDAVVDLNWAYRRLLAEKRGEARAQELADATVPPDLGTLIEAGDRGLDGARQALEYGRANPDAATVFALATVKLLAPYAGPAVRIPCAGGAFAAHSAGVVEAQTGEPGDVPAFFKAARDRGPWGFWKVARDVLGPDDDVAIPSRTQRFDYEGEVAAILGRRLRNATPAKGAAAIWGMVLLNDWSIRDGDDQVRAISFSMAKNFDGCTSLGPIIDVGGLDPQSVSVTTTVNGQVRQDFNTRDMIFSFGEYLAYLTRDLTLYPGDILSGGTGPGTAMDSSRKGPDGKLNTDRYLKPGDVVEVSAPELGTLRNRVVAPAGA